MALEIGVVFDMDGVMVDSNPYHKIALRKFCSQYGFALDEQVLRQKIYGRTNENWIRNLFGELPPQQIRQYAHEKEQLFRELYLPHIKPLDGLLEFLELLKRNAIPITIGTSAPEENVFFVLDHTGTQSYFGNFVSDKDIENSKPHPEVYLKAAKLLGLKASDCVVFEDSISGVEAGLSAGCTVVGISTTHSPEELVGCKAVLPDFKKIEWHSLLDWVGKK